MSVKSECKQLNFHSALYQNIPENHILKTINSAIPLEFVSIQRCTSDPVEFNPLKYARSLEATSNIAAPCLLFICNSPEPGQELESKSKNWTSIIRNNPEPVWGLKSKSQNGTSIKLVRDNPEPVFMGQNRSVKMALRSDFICVLKRMIRYFAILTIIIVLIG